MFSCQENLCFLPKDSLVGKKVLVVGLGGLGSHAAVGLVCSGVGYVGLCDFDTVELRNISRQCYTIDDIGKLKTVAMADNLVAKNPNVIIELFNKPFESSMVIGFDIVLDCTDNVASRLLVYDSCRQLGIPSIFGSAVGFEGQLLVNKCLRCIFPGFANSRNSCSRDGVFSPVPGLVGTLQAVEAVKYLSGNETVDNLLHIDLLSGTFNNLVVPDCNCKVNNRRPVDENCVVTIDLSEQSGEISGNVVGCPGGELTDVIQIIKNRTKGPYVAISEQNLFFRLVCEHGNRSEAIRDQLISLGYFNVI